VVKFTKQILRPGKYMARSPQGERSEVEITSDRLRHWVETFKSMRANGLKVPAPWRHDKSVPFAEDVKDSRDYAGYWEDTWIGDDGALYGRLDVPLAADAEKVGATVTEVSPYIKDWEDGKKNKYLDAMLHIGLVQHPVAPGQPNFQPVNEADQQPALALSLSLLTEGAVELAEEPATAPVVPAVTEPKPAVEPPAKASAASMQDVLTALKSVGLDLPEDTMAENLAERIITAAKAIAGKKAADQTSEPGAPGAQAKEQPIPIAMAGEIMPIDKTVSQDGKGLEFQTPQARESFEKQAGLALEFAADFVRRDCQRRINALIETGQITPAMVAERLRPLVEGFEMSLDAEGKRIPTELDRTLEILEALPPNRTGMAGALTAGNQTPKPSKKRPLAGLAFGTEEPMPPGLETGGTVTPERAKEVVETQFAAAGRPIKKGNEP